jgi:hypothetical protein
MQQKNTLVLGWDEVRDLLVKCIWEDDPEDGTRIDTENSKDVSVIPLPSKLILMWDEQPPQLVSSAEKVEAQPPCVLFNDACAPLLEEMELAGIPLDWLEKFLYAMSFVVRALERNGQVYMPEKFGHAVVGPLSSFSSFHQYLLTCLCDKWAVSDTTTQRIHERIVALVLWIGANSFPLFSQFRDEFLMEARIYAK